MKIEIINRFTGEVIFSTEAETIKEAVEIAVKSGVNLFCANLVGVNLVGVNLVGVNLVGAGLRGTILDGARLDGALLTSASLCGASLCGTSLRGTILDDAILDDAILDGDSIMPDGLKFSRYLSEVVPALLTAGGKSLKEVVESGCWSCHSWENCPMHVAFGIESPDDAPALLRQRVKEFIQFFDAGLIPEPKL
jgi:hypothetical protein